METNIKIFQKNQTIIHYKYGIGRYKGMCLIKNNNKEMEFLIIMYANQTKLYVPITSLSLISIYPEFSGTVTSLNTLGQEIWNKEKKKFTKKIYDIALQLINTYAKRKVQLGFSFKKNKIQYKKFCKYFPYKETKDQKKVIQEVLKDMSKKEAMDRLICGDVGFGKTEIAMRASFIAINNKKQVAILVPTTLLAQQHFKNFKKRFNTYSTKIKILTRFTKKKEIKKILEQLQTKKIDILIGTHKILSHNIIWKNLGLLVVDEEHRFGVSHKEMIKKLYVNIDILTLTATPIPRTLSLTTLGLRNVSIIAKPPKKRIPIKTFIKKYDVLTIRKIILKAIKKKGQIYYLYNKVKDIENKTIKLKKLIPEAKICIGHGQMSGQKLKTVMKDFILYKFDVLVCTTIIDTGIDISNVNTIIIENADKFGISQLHQLRGRVGRTSHQAYAWFFVNSYKKLTKNSKKRLNALIESQFLGSGFKLSIKDSEIRGTGEILGTSQSGHIEKFGINLYKKLLQNAIENLKKNDLFHNFSLETIDLDLNISALFPKNYIQNIHIRLFYYQKISEIKNLKELKKLKKNICNIYGILPIFANNLFVLEKIRIIGSNLNIKKIYSRSKLGYITFFQNPKINFSWLSKEILKNPLKWKITPEKIYFYRQFENDEKRIFWYYKWLKKVYLLRKI
ncbi:transcription-repair coupling factor [Buchnera aphidicola]|uniref:Transcription-repair-coupling factor n=1 Tax=Buchnera aphidicola subsp. Tuberolachnus salignus TaxID=98804 RepID=A0A160SVZ1_BUCTT|nr:transcription-repair coupling factor [Buchnera aphidicola]CUR53167.1 Transcription-repair-coupling factor [Buchnera aphidicola (Tuberolachnus salignus)]